MTQVHAPLIIGGEELRDGQEATQTTYDPATGKDFASYAVGGLNDIDAAVDAAREAFDNGPWKRLKPFERGRYLHKIGEELFARRDEIARRPFWIPASPTRRLLEVDCPPDSEFYAGVCDKLQAPRFHGPGVMD